MQSSEFKEDVKELVSEGLTYTVLWGFAMVGACILGVVLCSVLVMVF